MMYQVMHIFIDIFHQYITTKKNTRFGLEYASKSMELFIEEQDEIDFYWCTQQ